jgi:hypothetical protein
VDAAGVMHIAAPVSTQRHITYLAAMRALLVGLSILLLTPALASARGRTVAPPGNSAVNQYVESVPTASGGQPTGTIHAGGTNGSGPSNGPGGTAGGALPSATATALAHDGSDGAATAAVARATAPSRRHPAGTHSSAREPSAGGGSGSPISAVVGALTGSSAQGGLGLLLPAILLLSAVGAAAIALWRRRSV